MKSDSLNTNVDPQKANEPLDRMDKPQGAINIVSDIEDRKKKNVETGISYKAVNGEIDPFNQSGVVPLFTHDLSRLNQSHRPIFIRLSYFAPSPEVGPKANEEPKLDIQCKSQVDFGLRPRITVIRFLRHHCHILLPFHLY